MWLLSQTDGGRDEARSRCNTLSLLFRTDAIPACLRVGPAIRFPAFIVPAANDLVVMRVKEVAIIYGHGPFLNDSIVIRIHDPCT